MGVQPRAISPLYELSVQQTGCKVQVLVSGLQVKPARMFVSPTTMPSRSIIRPMILSFTWPVLLQHKAAATHVAGGVGDVGGDCEGAGMGDASATAEKRANATKRLWNPNFILGEKSVV